MRIQRHHRRHNWHGCGCLIAGIITVFVIVGLIPLLPDILFQLSGFEAVGETDAVFGEATPVPTARVDDIYAPPQVMIDTGTYGRQTFAGNTDTYTINVGLTGNAEVVTATFTEAGLMQLCDQYSDVCRNGDSRFRNVNIDLRPGGAVIYADVDVGFSQYMGVGLQLDGFRQFKVAGVDVNGTLYRTPPGELSGLVEDIERLGNDVLRGLTLQAGGNTYDLSELYVDHDTLTAILR